MPTMEHIEAQTRYHLIEVSLFYILVNDFLFFSLKISKLVKVKKFAKLNFQQKPGEKSCFPITFSSLSFEKDHLDTS